MIELLKLPERIHSIKSKDWAKLFDLLKELNRIQQFGELKEEEKLQQGVAKFPYYIHASIVDRFLEVVRELDIVPNFDWFDWKEGKEILNRKIQDYEELDDVTLCKLFTIIIRSDRFNEGFLVSCFNDGTIQKITSALKSKVSA